MKYFRMNFGDAKRAQELLWNFQCMQERELTNFNISASGRDTTIWTEDEAGEQLFRTVLDTENIQYEEGEQQQVVTWLDEIFGR